MIDYVPFLKILPVLLLALISPGPDFLLVSSLALARGQGAGLRGAAGVAAGLALFAALCLWGLGLLFARLAWGVMVVKILGGLYLCYLGLMMWRGSLRRGAVADSDRARANDGKRSAFGTGLLTTLTNPKTIAFFTSIFALMMPADASVPTKLVTVILCGVLAFGWYGFVVLAFSRAGVRARYLRWRKAIDRLVGTVMVVCGVRLVASARG